MAPLFSLKARRRASGVLSSTRGPPQWLCLLLLRWNHAYRAAAPVPTEQHLALNQREQRVVAAPANADARVEVGATLADEDLAGVHRLTAIPLHAEALGIGVTAVAAG